MSVATWLNSDELLNIFKILNGTTCPTIPKIKKLRKKIDSLDKEIRLEVDGGISKENISEVSKAGADTFVAGSAIFNTKNYKDTISNLKSLID